MASSNSLLIQSFSPFPTLYLSVPSTTQINDLSALINAKYPTFPTSLIQSHSLTFSTHSGRVPPLTSLVSELRSQSSDEDLITLRLTPCVLGGKGGFGSQLRAAGGRMSSQKTSNNDSCRDLNGRRLSTLKEAKKLAAYIEQEPQRLAAKAEAQRQKLENLERKLGIDPSSSSSSDPNVAPEPLAGKKHRFDDTEYLEKTEELKDNVKNAVAAALLKKKKAKLSHNGNGNGENGNGASGSKKAEGKAKIEETVKVAEKKEEVKATLISAQPLNPVPASVVSEAIGA